MAGVVMNLATGFSREGLNVDLVMTGTLTTRPHPLHPDVALIKLGSPGLRSAFAPLVRYLREAKPRSVLSSMEHLNILSVWARILSSTNARLVLTTHGHLSQRLQYMWGWRERVFLPPLISHSYPLADAIIGVSKGVAEDLGQFVPGSEVRTIYNPVVDSLHESLSVGDMVPAGFNGPHPVVLGVGRLTSVKNFPMLLRAFAIARKSREMTLVILGDGELKTELMHTAKSLGIDRVTHFMGQVRDPLPFFRHADVFVLSSRWEGFGNVLVEALSTGTPVVSTNCPSGPSEILEDGAFGILTPVGDVDAMANAILTTLQDPIDPEVLKKRAAAFSISESVRRYREVLCI